MYVLFVWLQVKPEHLDEYLQATIEGDAKGSITNEPDCFRFDVVQDQQDPTKIHFYEVYRDREAFQAHTRTPHYLKWAETVKDWYAVPPQAIAGTSLFPADASWVKQKP